MLATELSMILKHSIEKGTDGLPCCGEISIGPYTVVIFSQDE